MEQKYNGYAMPSKTPWVTNKPLKHKAPSKRQLELKRFFRTHDVSVTIDPETNEIKCKVKEKSSNGVRKTY